MGIARKTNNMAEVRTPEYLTFHRLSGDVVRVPRREVTAGSGRYSLWEKKTIFHGEGDVDIELVKKQLAEFVSRESYPQTPTPRSSRSDEQAIGHWRIVLFDDLGQEIQAGEQLQESATDIFTFAVKPEFFSEDSEVTIRPDVAGYHYDDFPGGLKCYGGYVNQWFYFLPDSHLGQAMISMNITKGVHSGPGGASSFQAHFRNVLRAEHHPRLGYRIFRRVVWREGILHPALCETLASSSLAHLTLARDGPSSDALGQLTLFEKSFGSEGVLLEARALVVMVNCRYSQLRRIEFLFFFDVARFRMLLCCIIF